MTKKILNNVISTLARIPFIGFALTILLTTALSVYLSNNIATPHFLWLAGSIGFIFLIRQPLQQSQKIICCFMAATLLATLLSGQSLLISIGLTLANTLEISLAAFVCIRHNIYKTHHLNIRSWFLIAGVYLIIATPISALSSAILTNDFQLYEILNSASQYWLGSIMGFLLLSIPLLVIKREPILFYIGARNLGISLVYAILIYGIFAITPFPFIYCILPFSLLALRFSTQDSAAIILSSICWVLLAVVFENRHFPAISTNSAQDIWNATVLTCFIPLLITLMVSEFHTRQRQVETLTERLTLANKAVNLGVWEWTVNNHDLWWDDAMYQLYGVTKTNDPIHYQTWRNCVHPEDIDHIERLLKDIVRGKREFSASFRIINPHTGLRYMQADATIITENNGKPSRYVGMSWDVTHTKETEIALQNAKQKAEVASLTKSEFVANMSHEIRTPLNATLGTVQLLHNTPLNPQQHKYLEMIKTSGESLLAVLNDILDFSKIEAGHMQLAPSIINLNDLIARLANLMSVHAGEKKLELIINIDPSVPQILEGDALRLQQILINLTSNAIRFTAEGEILLKVELKARQHDTVQLHFSVKDTGIGIPKHKQLSLFDAFTQADSSTTRQYGGTGLGLSIARRLIHLMGSELYSNSEEGLGAEFYFTIPMRAVSQSVTKHPLETQRLRVLVIDENPQTLQALRNIMASWYWEVITANSQKEALDIFVAANTTPKLDVIFIDWRIISHNTTIMNTLKDLGLSNTAIRVIMDTSHTRLLSLDSTIDSAFDAHLVKPITHSLLIETLIEAQTKRSEAPFPQQTEMRFSRLASLEGIKILMAEDNPLNQTVAKGMLEQFGAVVTVVNDGSEAVHRLQQHPQGWDIILLDVQMPVMDGYTACETLINMGVDTPIIAITAGVLAGERERCKSLGMKAFIAKPIEINEMISVITQWLPSDRLPKRQPTPLHSSTSQDEIFNPERLLRYMDRQSQYAQSIIYGIETLINTDMEQLNIIGQQLDLGHFQVAAKLIHGLKGSLGNLGAMQMHYHLNELESILSKQALQTSHPTWIATQHAMVNMLSSAKNWLNQQQSAALGGIESKNDTHITKTQLKQYLADRNLKAFEAYEQLKHQLSSELSEKWQQQLHDAINRLDFDQAIICLEEIA